VLFDRFRTDPRHGLSRREQGERIRGHSFWR
jgi:hypothetical protein